MVEDGRNVYGGIKLRDESDKFEFAAREQHEHDSELNVDIVLLDVLSITLNVLHVLLYHVLFSWSIP